MEEQAEHQHSVYCNCPRELTAADLEAATAHVKNLLDGKVTLRPQITIVPPGLLGWLHDRLGKQGV